MPGSFWRAPASLSVSACGLPRSSRTWLWVMFAGGVGSVLRYLLVLGHEASCGRGGQPVPSDEEIIPTVSGTFVVNVGAVVMAVVAATGSMEAHLS